MKATIVTPPTIEPVSVAEVKDYISVDTTTDDVLIADLIVAAREEVEDWTRRKMMTQVWDYFLDRFPSCRSITIPYGKLNTVTSVKYKNDVGVESTMTVGTDYIVETNGDQHGAIVLSYGVPWPSGTLYPSKPITIRFTCGWATMTAVPQKIRTAIKMRVAARYEDRGESVVGQTVVESKAAEMLIASERLWGNFE